MKLFRRGIQLYIPQSPKPKVSATKIFVNREKPLELFKKTVETIPKNGVELLVFYGVGGQGKTALREEFEAVLKGDTRFSHIHAAVLDLHDRKTIDPDLALLFIRNEIAKVKKVSFPAFDLVFEFYWKKAYPEREMPALINSWLKGSIELSSEFITDASKAVIGETIGAAVEGVPFGGLVKRGVAHSVKWGHKQWSLTTNEAIKTAFPKGVPENLTKIEEQLPYLLASDLAAHQENNEERRFVIFIDEYERVFEERGFASKIRENSFDKAVRSLVTCLKGTLIVILSREQLPWAEFPPDFVSISEWRNCIKEAHHRLEGLSCIDAEKFLLLVPVPEENIRQAIIDGSGAKLGDGIDKPIYPQLLDFQVKHYLNLKSQGEDYLRPEEFAIQADSFNVLRKKLFSRLIEYHGPSFVSTIKRLSVARYFDRCLFDFLVKKFATAIPLDQYNELVEMSFVEESKTEKIFKFHNSIREILQEYLSPEDLKNTHEALIEYYTPLASPADCKSITDTNIDALIELVYHQCCFSPEHVINWWSNFFKSYIYDVIVRQVEPSLRLLNETVEKSLGPDHPDTATSLEHLATNLDNQGRYSEAQPLHERALRIRERTLGPDHPITSISQSNLATNLDKQKRYSEAQPLYERALKTFEGIFGPDHPYTATSLNNLATNLDKQKRYSEAQPLYERALKNYEKTLGPDHPSTATSLGNLATNLDNQGRYSEAQPLQERALKNYEKTLGPDHPSTATSLNNLAINLDSQGRYSEAQPLHEQALRIRERTLGLDHPSTATSLNNLAINLDNQGRYPEAQSLRERALKIDEKILGPDHPTTSISLNNLATNLENQGRYSEAQPLYERALKNYEKTLGPDHPSTATGLNNLAINLDNQGRYSEAQLLHERGLKIDEKTLGPDHPSTSISLSNLATNLDNQGRYSEAQPFYEQALKIREGSLGQDHPDTIKTINKLVANLDVQGQHEKAEAYRDRARKIIHE